MFLCPFNIRLNGRPNGFICVFLKLLLQDDNWFYSRFYKLLYFHPLDYINRSYISCTFGATRLQCIMEESVFWKFHSLCQCCWPDWRFFRDKMEPCNEFQRPLGCKSILSSALWVAPLLKRPGGPTISWCVAKGRAKIIHQNPCLATLLFSWSGSPVPNCAVSADH